MSARSTKRTTPRYRFGGVHLRIGHVYRMDEREWKGLIYITEGAFQVDGRISNFWYWRRVNKDGTLSKRKYSGYGGHWPEARDVEIQTRVVPKKKSRRTA